MAVEFKLCKLFRETTKDVFKKNPKAAQVFKDFMAAKTNDPMQPFGGKDLPFKGGDLKGYLHVALAHDLRLIYKIGGKNPTYIYLYFVGTHDESGTGQPPNPKRQKQLAQKLDNQVFERKFG